MMKIGFSFGRCVRDIVRDVVQYEDVYLIVTGTYLEESKHVDEVVDLYLHRPGYLMGLDASRCHDVADRLFEEGKLYQPRISGHRPRLVSENMLWMDLAPTMVGGDRDGFHPAQSDQVSRAWKDYQLALKMTTTRTLSAISDPRDDF